MELLLRSYWLRRFRTQNLILYVLKKQRLMHNISTSVTGVDAGDIPFMRQPLTQECCHRDKSVRDKSVNRNSRP